MGRDMLNQILISQIIRLNRMISRCPNSKNIKLKLYYETYLSYSPIQSIIHCSPFR